MIAREIAAALGNARREGPDWRCRCPLHGGSSLTLRDGRAQLLVRCWAGCNSVEVLAELRRVGLLAGRNDGAGTAPMTLRSDDRDDTAGRIALARHIWEAAREARKSPVVAYLRSRGITMAPPCSLRWLPACPHPSGIKLPAMIARIDNVEGALIGIHRTYLQPDGSGKAEVEPPKAMLGRAAGGAVRLAPAAEMLMVAEGVETALAAMQATAQPVWAALSTSSMRALMLPRKVRQVVILADNDDNGAGQRAALAAARRWLAGGRRVRVAMPPEPGTDFADVLAGHAGAQAVEMCDAAA